MSDSILRRISKRKLHILFSIGLAALSVWLALPLFVDHSTPILRMSAGPDGTRRHTVAAYMCEEATDHNLSISLLPCAGCEDCLNLLKAGQLDVAVVNSGVVAPDDDDVMVLGAVQLEALHVLVRKDMVEGGSLAERLRGKRVNLGEKGSTEWLLSRELLSFARLKLPTASDAGDILPTELTKAQLIEKSRTIIQAEGAKKDALIEELPDCLLIVASMPSSLVQLLVEAADYRIVPIPATRAFLSDNLQDSDATTAIIEREFLERTVIPANSYYTTLGYPAADCETVGARLLVVANKNVPARALKPLMKTLFEGEFARRIQTKSPREIVTSYAIHPAAAAYLDRDKPLAIAEAMEWFNKGLSVFGAFSAGALSLYGLVWRKKARKPSDYYAEIRKLDLLSHGTQIDPSFSIETKQLVAYVDDRLIKLRQSLIEDVCEGRIKGEQTIANILALLNDARRNIPKMTAGVIEPSARVTSGDRSAFKAA